MLGNKGPVKSGGKSGEIPSGWLGRAIFCHFFFSLEDMTSLCRTVGFFGSLSRLMWHIDVNSNVSSCFFSFCAVCISVEICNRFMCHFVQQVDNEIIFASYICQIPSTCKFICHFCVFMTSAHYVCVLLSHQMMMSDIFFGIQDDRAKWIYVIALEMFLCFCCDQCSGFISFVKDPRSRCDCFSNL